MEKKTSMKGERALKHERAEQQVNEIFKRLDGDLEDSIDEEYFSDANYFRTLVKVLDLIGQKVDQSNDGKKETDDILMNLKDSNPGYNKILNQREIAVAAIEEIVQIQHGGMNNSLDTMNDVIKEYKKGRADIQGLRTSLQETQSVLTANKSGQTTLKELCLSKLEVEHMLKIAKELEVLKNTAHKVNRFVKIFVN